MTTLATYQHRLYEAALREGVSAFRRALAKYHDEHFYAICFYTCDTLDFIFPTANTHEGLSRALAKSTYDEPIYYKWSPAEWDLDFGQCFPNNLMPDTISALESYPDNSTCNFELYERSTFETLNRALLAIREQGVLADHPFSDRLAFFPFIFEADERRTKIMLERALPYLLKQDAEEISSLFISR